MEGAGKIFKAVNSGNPIIGFCLNGIDLPEKLLRFGITTDKRYSWVRPNISDDMLPHFLRGWYDGDGHIGKKSIMTLTNINEEAIRYYEEKIRFLGYTGNGFIKSRLGSGYSRVYKVENNVVGKLGKNRDVWRHTISGKENCLLIYKLLHGGSSSLRLDRKWEILE